MSRSPTAVAQRRIQVTSKAATEPDGMRQAAWPVERGLAAGAICRSQLPPISLLSCWPPHTARLVRAENDAHCLDLRTAAPSSLRFAHRRRCTPCFTRVCAAVQSELRDWLQHPPDGCKLVQYEDLRTWVIQLLGPESPCQPQLYTGEQ
jgi:hypothetical protein